MLERRAFWVAAALVFSGSLGWPTCPVVADEATVSLEAIFNAWEQRSDTVKSLRLDWVNKRVHPEGRADRKHYLVLGQNTVRIHDHTVGNEAIYRDFSFYDKVSLTFQHSPVMSDQSYPYAVMTRPETMKLGRKLSVAPPIWLHRMTARMISGFGRDSFLPSIRATTLDGRRRIVLSERIPQNTKRDPFALSPEAVSEYWLAPEFDFAVVQYKCTLWGTVLRQVEVSYETDADGQVRLKGWRVVNRRVDGQVRYEVKCEVQRREVNPELLPLNFGINLPPGTVLHDTLGTPKYYFIASNRKRIAIDGDKKWSYREYSDKYLSRPNRKR